MAVTTAKSIETYAAAREALMRIIAAPQLTNAERSLAQAKLDMLINDYLEWTTENLEKRTGAYVEFTEQMEALLKQLKKYAAGVEPVKRLAELVKDARKVLEKSGA